MRPSLVAGLLASLATGAVLAAESLQEPSVVTVSAPFTEQLLRGLLGAPPPMTQVQDDAVNYRKPILKAAGTQPVGEGQERIAIPVDGVAYEVVVTKPHPLGLMIPVAR